MKRLILAIGVLLMVAGPLAACGKKGPPEPPGQNQYPRKYPAES